METMEAIKNYLAKIKEQRNTGLATEHSYRGILQSTLENLANDQNIQIINEPKRIEAGAPDFIITQKKHNIPIGYIEAKDIVERLDDKKHTEQFERYKNALDNLIITDYLRFDFYRQGKKISSVQLATNEGERLLTNSTDCTKFLNLWKNFILARPQNISSSEKLAEMMATKARLMQNIIERSVCKDVDEGDLSDLFEQFEAFKLILIHDLTENQFSDIYAQTIAYGMFAARIHDESLDSFSREEAAKLIPKSNPFLRKLFNHIAGIDLDERLAWLVDDLVEIFKVADIKNILSNFTKKQQDPIIHFYETFLLKYNPTKKKERGVWYTPEAVVSFIVRAIDDTLQTDFGLSTGLADTSKTEIQIPLEKNKKIKKKIHKLQILDPATGTGTFLAAIIKHVYKQHFQDQQGIWSSYVEKDLLPRLNGFELLMASYAIAHIKLELVLRQTGFILETDKRLQIYLTNTLEEAHPDTGTLFAQWLAREAEEANYIKRDTPVMVVLGNPPYSGESQNKSNWIMQLMEDYKKEPGGKEKLKERNPKWINDDYMKFIRMSQHYIERNGQGVVAFINPHGFLDNPTFRGARWHLLKTFDKIYTIDLHGNSKKKETAPDGSKDENVFDIQQGVAINLFIKTGKKKANQLAQVHHFDLYGKRESKYKFLNENSISSIKYKKLPNLAPNYFFVHKDFELEAKYNKGFGINKLFPVNSVGVVTAKDKVLINEKSEALKKTVANFFDIASKQKFIKKIAYRPYDYRYIYFDLELIERGREKVMRHFLVGDNVGLSLCKQFKTGNQYVHAFLSDRIIESSYVSNRTSEITSIFPLYLYPAEQELYKQGRRPNLNSEIVEQMVSALALPFVKEKQDDNQASFAPIDVLDYIYAVLHSPNYREKYKEFLKIDFPRVPYPNKTKTFWQLVELGGQIRRLHLLEENSVKPFITGYPVAGTNEITRSLTNKDFVITDKRKQLGQVWINDTQYFDKVPLVAWEFFVGGYQPAQKWLKDRKKKTLHHEDVLHYQKIIVALQQTHNIMQKIDRIKFINPTPTK